MVAKVLNFIWGWLQFRATGEPVKCSPASIDSVRINARELADALEAAYGQAWDTGDIRCMDEIRVIVRELAGRISGLASKPSDPNE